MPNLKTAAAKTVAKRAAGGRPSRLSALLVAGGAGIATATVVYKVLRSDGDAPTDS